MEFMNVGDPLPRDVPGSEEMLAEFGQPIAVLDSAVPGTAPSISGGGFNGQLWYLDVDYLVDYQLVERVRTIRELPSPPAHGQLGDPLRSALIEFSVNAESTGNDATSDPERPQGQQLTVQQEKLAALATRSESEVTIDGRPHDAIALHIRGYRAYQTVLGKAIVIHVGADHMPPPTLRAAAATKA